MAEGRDSAEVAKRILDEQQTEDPRVLTPLWMRLGEAWAVLTQTNEAIDRVDFDVVGSSDFGLDQAEQSERLDLDYLSGADQVGD